MDETMKDPYRFRRLAALVSGARRVLDVGCADEPNAYLRNPEVCGLDRRAGELTPNYTDSRVGDVMDLPEPFGEAAFDAITAGEILEHLEQPLLFLRNCRRVLATGGRLALSTPNPNSPMERLLTLTLSRRFYYTKNHVCLYPQRWLIRLMEIAGFEDVRVLSGGLLVPGVATVPFPRPWAGFTIATGLKR